MPPWTCSWLGACWAACCLATNLCSEPTFPVPRNPLSLLLARTLFCSRPGCCLLGSCETQFCALSYSLGALRQLDKVVGESAGDVDWRRSYYLNLICHTEYSLTVAICRYAWAQAILGMATC